MRNILFFTLSVCAILLASCSKSDIDATMLSKDTVTAILPDNEQQTRTTINGLQVVWSAEDAISVFTTKDSGYANDKGTIKEGDEGKTSADFEIVRTGTDKVASLYPYYSSSSYNGTSISVVMPDSYNYVENGIGGSPMAALISDQSAPIAFKNAGALLAVTINNIPANYNKATLESTDSEVIAGESIITFTDGIPTIKPSDNNTTAKSVTINFASSSQATNKTFHFPLVVNNYRNLKLTISDGSNTKILFEAGLNAARNKRYYKTLTLDVVSGDTPTDAASSEDATAALAGTNGSEGASSVNVTIGAGESATPTISLPKQDNPESSSTTLSFNSIPDNKVVTIQEAALANDEKPSENVYIYASSDANSNNSFDINLPQSTVTLNATTGTAVYETVTALTADNTLVVGNGVTVNKLVVKGGNVRVRGSIESISRHEDNENPVYLYVEEGAKIPANLPAGIQTAVMVKNADEFNAAVKGTASVIVLAEHFMDVPEILTINRPLTLDGNNKNIGSDASRAINVDTDGVVNIKNLSITGSNKCERGINIINKAGTTNIDNVTISPLSHYAVHVASSAGAAKVNITNSNLTSWSALAVYGEGSVINVKDSCLTGENKLHKDTDSNSYCAIDAGNGDVTINVIGGTISAISKEGMDNMAIVGTNAGATGANIYLKSNLLLDGLNTCYISMPIEGNTLKIQNGDAKTISEKYPYTFGEPDENNMVQVTGVAEGVAVITEIKELYDAAADEDINHIVLAANIPSITETVEIKHDLTITINGYNFVNNVKGGRAFKVNADGVNLSLNAVNSNVGFGNGTYGMVELANEVDSATVTINGGTFNGTTDCGALVRFRSGNNNTVTLNDVNYTENCELNKDSNTNAFVVGNNQDATENTLIITGGSYNVPAGFGMNISKSVFDGVTITAKGAAIECGKNSVNWIRNCTITLDPGSNVYQTPGSCVTASEGATINVLNSVLTAKNTDTYTLAVLPTGGTINYDEQTETKMTGDVRIYDKSNGNIKLVDTIEWPKE